MKRELEGRGAKVKLFSHFKGRGEGFPFERQRETVKVEGEEEMKRGDKAAARVDVVIDRCAPLPPPPFFVFLSLCFPVA